MTNKQRMQTMLGYFEMMSSPDKQKQEEGMKGLLGMMSEDVVWTTQGPSDIIPWAGEAKGRDGVMKMFGAQGQAIQPATFEANPVFIGGDDEAYQVFYMPMESVTLVAPPHNVYKTGFAMIFQFDENGMVISVMSMFDTYAVAKAFKP